MYEREHDEALLDVEDQEEPEMEEDEEDPPEEPETEVIAVSDEEDPSEESETEVIAIPDEEDPDEVPVAEERVGPMVVYAGIPLPTLPVVRAPTPPPLSWIPDDDSSETHTSEPRQTEEAPSAAPDSPPLDPAHRQSSLAHGYVQDVLRTRVAVAEGRLDEARRELDAERAGRRTRAYETRASIPRSLRRELTGIELTSRARLRSLQGDRHGRISRRQADYIFRRAMERVWELTRSGV